MYTVWVLREFTCVSTRNLKWTHVFSKIFFFLHVVRLITFPGSCPSKFVSRHTETEILHVQQCPIMNLLVLYGISRMISQYLSCRSFYNSRQKKSRLFKQRLASKKLSFRMILYGCWQSVLTHLRKQSVQHHQVYLAGGSCAPGSTIMRLVVKEWERAAKQHQWCQMGQCMYSCRECGRRPSFALLTTRSRGRAGSCGGH